MKTPACNLSFIVATLVIFAAACPSEARADGLEGGLFLDPDFGLGFGLGGTNFDRDEITSGARDVDSYTPQEGFQTGISVGVPLFPGLYLTPRIGFNYGQFSYFPDATDTQEETTRSFATLHFSVGLRGQLNVPGEALSVFVSGAFAIGANLSDFMDFVDAGNTTNNETIDTSYDAGVGGRFELGIGYEVAPGFTINIRFFVQGLSMPISKTVRKLNDGNPDEIREFKGGVIQETGNIRRQDEFMHGVWGLLLGVSISL